MDELCHSFLCENNRPLKNTFSNVPVCVAEHEGGH